MCVSRYRMMLLTIAVYNSSGKVSAGSNSLQARLICMVAGSASPTEQQENCNSARCRILRTMDSASGSGEAIKAFISWLNRADSMEWILLAPFGELIFHYADKSRITFHEAAGRVLLAELDLTTFHSDGSTIDAFWDTNTGALHSNHIVCRCGTTAGRWSRIQTFHCEVAVLENTVLL